MPTVSVVVPTFRRPQLLAGAVASALAQTYDDLEVLVCDNDDDPVVARIVADFGDDRVRYLPRPVNLGMLRSAVEGFRSARGLFVAKLDDDDTFYPTLVERLVGPLLADDTVGVSFGRFELVDAEGATLPAERAQLEEITGRDTLAPGRHTQATALAAAGTIDLVCALVRADRVDFDRVPDAVATAYDRHIVLQAVRDGAGAHFTPELLAGYRIHPGADSRTALPRQAVGAVRALELTLAEERHPDVAPLTESHRTLAIAAVRTLLREGRMGEARHELEAARRRHPADPTLRRLAHLAALPGPLASGVARRRFEAGRRVEASRQPRLV